MMGRACRRDLGRTRAKAVASRNMDVFQFSRCKNQAILRRQEKKWVIKIQYFTIHNNNNITTSNKNHRRTSSKYSPTPGLTYF
jgi:hypothetical protein